MRHTKRSERGITLIELLVAIVVLGIIAAPILGCISLFRQNVAEARTQALVDAMLRDAVVNKASEGLVTSLVTGILPTTNKRLPGGIDVTLTTDIGSVSGYTNLYKIKATATWDVPYAGSRTDTASLETYVVSPN